MLPLWKVPAPAQTDRQRACVSVTVDRPTPRHTTTMDAVTRLVARLPKNTASASSTCRQECVWFGAQCVCPSALACSAMQLAGSSDPPARLKPRQAAPAGASWPLGKAPSSCLAGKQALSGTLGKQSQLAASSASSQASTRSAEVGPELWLKGLEHLWPVQAAEHWRSCQRQGLAGPRTAGATAILLIW